MWGRKKKRAKDKYLAYLITAVTKSKESEITSSNSEANNIQYSIHNLGELFKKIRIK